MQVHINLWGILLAAVSSMLIGAIYYSDNVFGKHWKELGRIDNNKLSKTMPKLMPLVFVAALITSYIVAYVTYLFHNFFQISWLTAGIETALILWVGISATTLFIHDSLNQRPIKLTIISIGNRLLSILAMGLIIGWLHP